LSVPYYEGDALVQGTDEGVLRYGRRDVVLPSSAASSDQQQYPVEEDAIEDLTLGEGRLFLDLPALLAQEHISEVRDLHEGDEEGMKERVQRDVQGYQVGKEVCLLVVRVEQADDERPGATVVAEVCTEGG